MSTLALGEPELPMAAADFEALERRVLRTVELLKSEREARAAAEERALAAEEKANEHEAVLGALHTELTNLKKERDGVRSRVEGLLKQLDDLSI